MEYWIIQKIIWLELWNSKNWSFHIGTLNWKQLYLLFLLHFSLDNAGFLRIVWFVKWILLLSEISLPFNDTFFFFGLNCYFQEVLKKLWNNKEFFVFLELFAQQLGVSFKNFWFNREMTVHFGKFELFWKIVGASAHPAQKIHFFTNERV